MRHQRALALAGLFTSVLLIGDVGAYEVTTHQELTRRSLVGDSRSENLKFFLRTFDLEDTDYSEEGDITRHWITGLVSSIQASGPYRDVADQLTNDHENDLNIFIGGDYRGIVETGAILEDTAISVDHFLLDDGRFLRHFYDMHLADQCIGLNAPTFGLQTCSREWGFDGGGDEITNDFTFVNARNYYRDSIKGSTKDKRSGAQAMLFLTMGHLAHLLEDVTQPSHARDDPHGGRGAGGPTAIEPWASIVFRVGTGDCIAAPDNCIENITALIDSAPEFNPISYRDLFDDTARFVHNNFLSDDTIPVPEDDGGHNALTGANLNETPISGKFSYMEANGLIIPDGTRLGIHTERRVWERVNRDWVDAYDLVATIDGAINENVLIDNVSILFPASIARVEGLFNFMFRARILATPNELDSNQLIIRNITDQSKRNGSLDLTIKAGAIIEVLYDKQDGTRAELLPPTQLSYDFRTIDSVVIGGFQDAIARVSETIGPEKRITVVVSGLMGGDDVDADWIVAGATFNIVENASVLFSFDRSASMGGEIENAKASGLTVVPILALGMDNYAAVHSFSSSAGVDQPHTNDFAAVRSAIQGVSSGGNTALYDAIVLAGQSSSIEKLDRPANKSIIILYTDGVENTSNASIEQAVEAISKIDHPEIDVVYLVFLGSGTAGASILDDIAAQSGRRFLRLESVDQLASEIINIIK